MEKNIICSPIVKEIFDKRIWRIIDVAEYLQLSVKTIYNKTSRSEIPHFKKGKVLYFRPEEIENWLLEGNLE
jgi:excisionase family DNA binding protein